MTLMICFEDCLLSLVKEWTILFEGHVSSQWFLTEARYSMKWLLSRQEHDFLDIFLKMARVMAQICI